MTLTCSDRKNDGEQVFFPLSELAFQQHLSLSGPNDGLLCATESRINISNLTSIKKNYSFLIQFPNVLLNFQSQYNTFHERKVHLKKKNRSLVIQT